MPQKSALKKKLPKSSSPIVYITGESPLVEEYALVCKLKGYEVITSINASLSPADGKKKKAVKSAKIPAKTSLALEVTNTDLQEKRNNIQRLDDTLAADAAILTSSITVTATEQAGWIRHRHRLVGFSALPTLSGKPLVEIAPTVFSPKETLDVVLRFFASLDKEVEIVQDRVGMVLPRILCQIINEATFALMEDVASPKDIDTAMKLGANYPFGPIEWTERIGLKHVYAVLTALERDLQEDRYRISPLLRQMVLGGEWWKHTN
ncbi:MAG TPA: 3-hydroxyacyl-CoA dehydrogenase family protein [Bacteroidota bacterium]|nr:3-hydroxyacyl-CoA dehydrogenase family protein [Bacteroidota bacterium]